MEMVTPQGENGSPDWIMEEPVTQNNERETVDEGDVTSEEKERTRLEV